MHDTKQDGNKTEHQNGSLVKRASEGSSKLLPEDKEERKVLFSRVQAKHDFTAPSLFHTHSRTLHLVVKSV